MANVKHTFSSILTLAVLLPIGLHAELGVKMGNVVTGDRIGGALSNERLQARSYIIREKKIRDVVETANRKSGPAANKKNARLSIERATTERIKNKQKKLINSN